MAESAQKQKRPKLADVASRAGVSIATVSHVLNGRHDVFVGRAARQRVMETARELGYRPNVFARSLRTQTTRSFGLIFPGMKSEYLSGLAEAVYREARRRNYHVLLEPEEAADAEGQINAVGNLISRMVDGIVIFWPYGVWNFSDTPALPPVVLVDTDARSPALSPAMDEVRVDRAAGIERAVGDLLRRGRRQICLLISEFDDRVTHERVQGWQRAHRAAGMTADEKLIVRVSSRAVYQSDTGRGDETYLRMRATAPSFDAVVASGDLMAIEICNAMSRRGIAIGRDVAIVGFGDVPYCALMPMPLSSIGFPVTDIARATVEMLIQRIESPAGGPSEDGVSTREPRLVSFPMEYHPRESCGEFGK